MTDNEIINAFEEISKKQNSNLSLAEQLVCAETLSLIGRLKVESKKYRNKYQSVKEEIARLYDTINRQKAEIERMKKENEILSRNADTAFQDGLNENRDLFKKEVESEIKAEAIKEFARRLKEAVGLKTLPSLEIKIIIDELVKEMMKEK